MYPVFVKALLLSFLLFQTEESSPFKGEGVSRRRTCLQWNSANIP